jgi:hypothetical protein
MMIANDDHGRRALRISAPSVRPLPHPVWTGADENPAYVCFARIVYSNNYTGSCSFVPDRIAK